VNSTICRDCTRDNLSFGVKLIYYIDFVTCIILSYFSGILFHFCKNVCEKGTVIHIIKSGANIKFGFTVTERNRIHLPQCVLCHAVLNNDAMTPGGLERHLNTNHKKLKEKPKEIFCYQTTIFETQEAGHYRSSSSEHGQTRGSILLTATSHCQKKKPT
jgi:hypothetical protein